jgi:hypothetical protein
MNIQTLVKDGLAVRADVVLSDDDDPTLLSKVFAKSFLEQDTLLRSTAYQPFDVSEFDYKSDVGFALVLPWQSTVTIRVTEKVTDIQAELYATEEDQPTQLTVPSWDNGIYDVTVTRYEDNWRIVSMTLVEMLPQPTLTPSPSVTATPELSPTPSAENPDEIIED